MGAVRIALAANRETSLHRQSRTWSLWSEQADNFKDKKKSGGDGEAEFDVVNSDDSTRDDGFQYSGTTLYFDARLITFQSEMGVTV